MKSQAFRQSSRRSPTQASEVVKELVWCVALLPQVKLPILRELASQDPLHHQEFTMESSRAGRRLRLGLAGALAGGIALAVVGAAQFAGAAAPAPATAAQEQNVV